MIIMDKNKKYLHLLFSIQLIAIAILIFANDYLYKTINVYLFNSLLLLLCFFSYVLLYKIIKDIMSSAHNEAKYESLIKQKKIQEEHRIALAQNRKHLERAKEIILDRMIHEDDITKKTNEENRSYINQLIKEYMHIRKTDNCKNKIIDAILYNKALLAETKNIPFQISTILPEEINIDHIDLMCVFTNLLDNAIEANECVDVTKRFVSIIAKIESNCLIVKVENAKSMNQKILIEKFYTTKVDKDNHGLGLAILNDTCGKYQGKLKVDDKGDVAIIKAMLRLKDVK